MCFTGLLRLDVAVVAARAVVGLAKIVLRDVRGCRYCLASGSDPARARMTGTSSPPLLCRGRRDGQRGHDQKRRDPRRSLYLSVPISWSVLRRCKEVGHLMARLETAPKTHGKLPVRREGQSRNAGLSAFSMTDNIALLRNGPAKGGSAVPTVLIPNGSCPRTMDGTDGQGFRLSQGRVSAT